MANLEARKFARIEKPEVLETISFNYSLILHACFLGSYQSSSKLEESERGPIEFVNVPILDKLLYLKMIKSVSELGTSLSKVCNRGSL